MKHAPLEERPRNFMPVDKHQVSFTKAKRFVQAKESYNTSVYYRLKEVKSKRATTFGKGERSTEKLLN